MNVALKSVNIILPAIFTLITYNNLVLALNNFLYGIILGRPNYERVQAKFIWLTTWVKSYNRQIMPSYTVKFILILRSINKVLAQF